MGPLAELLGLVELDLLAWLRTRRPWLGEPGKAWGCKAFWAFDIFWGIAFGNFFFVFLAFLRHLQGILGLFRDYHRITRGTRPRCWIVLFFPFIFGMGDLEKGFRLCWISKGLWVYWVVFDWGDCLGGFWVF